MKNHSFLKRLGYAFAGLRESWKSESSFRIHVLGLVFVLVVLSATRPAPLWWAILLLASGAVVGTELINTAVEKLIDHIHPDQHAIIGIVKDALAGAVLVTSVNALLIFVAFIWSLIGA